MNILKRRTFDELGRLNYPALADRRGWSLVPERPIYELQCELDGIGYPIKPDGAFGSTTEKAIKWVQERKGLVTDGVYGPDTAKAIREFERVQPDALFVAAIYRALESRGLKYSHTDYEIVGIRQKYNLDHTRNAYDDRIVIIGPHCYETFQASTDPGVKYSAVLMDGQQLYYAPGLHQRKHPCLRPAEGQKFKLIDKNGKPNERFGWFNIHAGGNPSRRVRNWSEGCQVIAGAGGWKSRDYRRFLDLTYHNPKQKRFRYSLIRYEDIGDE